MQLRFPRRCNKLLLIQLRFRLAPSRYVRGAPSLSLFFSLPSRFLCLSLPPLLYLAYLPRASCVTTYIYILPVEATAGNPEDYNRYALHLSRWSLARGRKRVPTARIAYFFPSTSGAPNCILLFPASSSAPTERWLWPGFLCSLVGANSIV